MKLSTALVSGILAVSFSSLAAAAQPEGGIEKSASDTNASASTGAGANVGATTDVKKNRKGVKAKAAGGASSSADTGADGRANSNASSPSSNSGTPGHASQGSVHNDESKK
jgi:hypothetical protein